MILDSRCHSQRRSDKTPEGQLLTSVVFLNWVAGAGLNGVKKAPVGESSGRWRKGMPFLNPVPSPRSEQPERTEGAAER